MTSRTVLDCTLYGSLHCLWQVLFDFVHYSRQSFTLYDLENIFPLSQHSFPHQKQNQHQTKPQKVHLSHKIVKLARMLAFVLTFFFPKFS